MHLKTYQQNALDQIALWLDTLKSAHDNQKKLSEICELQGIAMPEEQKNYPRIAWQKLTDQNSLPGLQRDGETRIPDYISRTADSDEPIPHVCLRVPTGGGKTLLGVAALGRIKQSAGFVLWIVPTRAIYEQTFMAFRIREHPYRQMLERISGGRVKLLQKSDHFTRQDIENYLCVMMLMLPSANRQQGREFLKIFRDSGGYTSFFPEQDDSDANRELSEKHPDLERNRSGDWVKQSLINTLKLIRPTVILDEAHKAYGPNDQNNRQFVKSVNRLNPRFVLELSATPKIGISNILVNISGTELKDEEMIKLPIEIFSFDNSDWKHTLAETQGKLEELEADARKLRKRENRHIRPIALVRVQRTGKDQRELGYIHSDDVREYLIRNLSVPENHVRIQSSEQKELAGEDLLSEESSVRWIITKDALKEGWDCSFAYILALLDSTNAPTTVTQMVGRVMRQPHARRIKNGKLLNRCYIYCYNTNVGQMVQRVKEGLEKEGLTGLDEAIHGYGSGDDAPERKTVKRRRGYGKLRIFLPQVLHRAGRGWRLIDYDRDVLGAIEWEKIDGGNAVELDDPDIIQQIRTTVDIQGENEVSEERLDTGEELTLDYFVRRLIDLIPNPWQAARVAEGFIRKHRRRNHDDAKLLNNRIYLSEVLRRRVKHSIDSMAESVFRDKVRRNAIHFHLTLDERLDHELEKSFEVLVSAQERTLQGTHGRPIQRSLFEPVYESHFNNLEKDFALYLDGSDAIHWWHRVAARQGYSLQGWGRHRMYPDFIACRKDDGRLLILETKGMQLKGSEDTGYKTNLLETLEQTYAEALDRGELEVDRGKAPPMQFRMMFQGTWEEEMGNLLSGDD